MRGKNPGCQYSEIPIWIGARFFITLLTPPHHLSVCLFVQLGVIFQSSSVVRMDRRECMTITKINASKKVPLSLIHDLSTRFPWIHRCTKLYSMYISQRWKTSFMFFLFIAFLRVTLVNKIIQVSGAQFHNTSPVHCIVCAPPRVRSLSPFSLLYPPPLFPTSLPLAVTTLLSFLFFPFFAQSLHHDP